jgi:hypothetical protein
MIDILLITPPSPMPFVLQVLYNFTGMSPLGLGYIASVLQVNGYTVEKLNLYLGLRSIEKFKSFLYKKKPKVIGFSTMTETHWNKLILAKVVKDTLPKSTIIFG